ncbi:MAG: hypothetical protein ABMA15_03515 [Vicinamibacterales bacterium]
MSWPKFRTARWFTVAFATVGYAALATTLTWPLATHLRTALLGDPTGDTGVYVWNLWIFRHELVTHGRLPFSTDHIFAYTGGVDFSLHNYTPLAGLVGTPLMPWLGVVGAFNAVMLAFLTLSGLGTFMLGRQVGLRSTAAWIAGGLFVAAPLVTARETAHLSLITNASLPLFLWALLRTLDRPRLRNGALVGLVVAMATYSDAYYGVYCVLMGMFLLASRFLLLEGSRPSGVPSRMTRWTDVAVLLIAAFLVWRAVSGTLVFSLGPLRVRLETLYTPMLALVILGGLRAWLTWRPSLRFSDPDARLRLLVGPGILAVAVCVALLSPLLAGLVNRYAQGRWPDTVTYWRSSPRGVDALAYLVPNPNHAWFGQWTQRWLLPDVADAFPEFVASFSLVALAGIAVTLWRRGLPRMWVAFTAVFFLLSLGPFIHVGGLNTFVVGPWALLRYVPVIGMARSPSRFAIVAVLGLSLLVAFALEVWLAGGRRGRRVAAGALVILVALEVIPAPRTLYSASVPDIYQFVATTDDEKGHLLELPTGVRDGTSSIGDFNASTAFFQTGHGRPLVGGYLSRVSEWRKQESLNAPMLRALFMLSERAGPLPGDVVTAARKTRDAFLARTCVRYVVVDKRRASSDLRAFATDVLGLKSLHEDDRYELLAPTQPPACEAPLSGAQAMRRGVGPTSQRLIRRLRRWQGSAP